jgi:hypothetical protein
MIKFRILFIAILFQFLSLHGKASNGYELWLGYEKMNNPVYAKCYV